jgi:methylthioribose-1-phosphate isomerase
VVPFEERRNYRRVSPSITVQKVINAPTVNPATNIAPHAKTDAILTEEKMFKFKLNGE